LWSVCAKGGLLSLVVVSSDESIDNDANPVSSRTYALVKLYRFSTLPTGMTLCQ